MSVSREFLVYRRSVTSLRQLADNSQFHCLKDDAKTHLLLRILQRRGYKLNTSTFHTVKPCSNVHDFLCLQPPDPVYTYISPSSPPKNA